MKKITIMLLMFSCLVFQVKAQVICSVFDENFNTCTAVFQQDGRFYIESRLMETGESLGTICIGNSVHELTTVMLDTKYFLDHPELEYVLIRIGDEFPKLYREPEEMEDTGTDTAPFLTDGTEVYLQVTAPLIDEILQSILATR